MMKNRVFKTFLLMAIGLAIAGLIAYVQIKNDESTQSNSTSIVAKNFGGDLNLTTDKGGKFTQDDFETSQYRLIYFGFTYCPAICPTELQRISNVINDLGPQGDKITPYFITVDPERDTVDVLHQYMGMFHPRFVGLTGTLSQIDEAKKSYKIYAAKVQDETMTDYTMDHSSFIYFISHDNDLLRVFKADDSIEDMRSIIQNYI